MRPPDEGIRRDRALQVRLTPEQQQILDGKRGTLSQSAWIRAAIDQWDGPFNGHVASLPKPASEPEPDIPMADGKTPGLVEVRTPGSAIPWDVTLSALDDPPPVAPENGKPHRHRAVTENIARYDKGQAVKLMVCACGHSWER